jgi:hypothetical protein
MYRQKPQKNIKKQIEGIKKMTNKKQDNIENDVIEYCHNNIEFMQKEYNGHVNIFFKNGNRLFLGIKDFFIHDCFFNSYVNINLKEVCKILF